ncbi:MAG: hypothetical protein WDO73_12755 [Ignavibacteriota bacterium]
MGPLLGPISFEFGASQRLHRRLTGGEFVVKALHQAGGGAIIHIPESSDYIASAGTEERPGESSQAFTIVSAAAGCLARRRG